MNATRETLLPYLAGKYVWWTTPEQALKFQQRVVAHVMNIEVAER